MIFPDSYFEDEVREGFFITSMMKRCWASQLQILEDIDSLCKKYGIKYYGDCGTLIGAVRHGGYIPWDDDLDICLLREDYEKLLEHAHELPKNYSVLNWRLKDDWTDAFSRIVNTEHICFDKDFMDYYHGCPYAMGIDIFVLDYMYEDSEKEEERRSRAEMLMQIAHNIQDLGKINKELRKCISDAEKLCGIKIDRHKSVVKQLYAHAEKAITEVKRKDATKVCFMAAWIEYHSCFWDKKYCDQFMRVPFECTTIPIPVAYDVILKAHYGDYMKTNRSGGAHEYPCYAKQERILIDKSGFKAWNYHWNKDELTFSERIRNEAKIEKETLKLKIQKIENMIAAQPEVYGGLQSQVDQLKSSFKHLLSEEKKDYEEVVFLTLGPRYWKNYSYFWNKEIEKSDTHVYVIPISYFDTLITGTVYQTHYETEGYEIPVTSIDEYDISKRHPDRIYVQCPYDDMNPAMNVHSAFYSKELLKYTNELIYVPMFDIKEFDSNDAKSAFGLRYMATMPVLFHCDKIYLPTERLKEEYVKSLVDFSKGDTDEDYWNKKIFVEDFMKEEPYQQSNNKKTILYYTDVAPIALYGKKSLDKIRSSLVLLKNASDRLNVIWLISGNMKDVLDSPECHDGRKLYSQFQNIVHDFKKEKWGYYTDTANDINFEYIDAYAGNPSPYAHILSYNKKPVMILKDFDD